MIYGTRPGPDTFQVCNVLMRKGCLELVEGFNPPKRWQGPGKLIGLNNKNMWFTVYYLLTKMVGLINFVVFTREN